MHCYTAATMPESRAVSALPAVLLCLAAACGPSAAQPEQGPPERAQQRHLLIVLDGLRPDYVTPEVMPNLHALGERGVVFTDHHAVYPTVTRVNAASISTGAYPETHGLMGNAVFFPAVDAARFLSTSERDNLLRVEEVEGERLLTAPTLGERLQGAGLRMLVASAGSSGSSYLLNHRVAGGGIIHYEYALPEALGEAVEERLGPPPPAAMPNRDRNRYIVDAFLEVGLGQVDPAVTVLWLSDPDTTAHATASDTRPRKAWSRAAGSGAIYVRDGDAGAVAGIVEALQGVDRVGAIFTRDARVPGTLAFDAARWDHARSADILYSPAWTNAENEHGYRGTSASGGTAGHGSTSPYDIHNTLIAAGPALHSGIEVGLPTSNVDFAPTFLYLLGLSAAPTMAGRPLTEAFRDGPELAAEPRSSEIGRETPDGRYRATARTTVVLGRRYLDSATAERP